MTGNNRQLLGTRADCILQTQTTFEITAAHGSLPVRTHTTFKTVVNILIGLEKIKLLRNFWLNKIQLGVSPADVLFWIASQFPTAISGQCVHMYMYTSCS